MAYATHWEKAGIRWVFTVDVTDQDLILANTDLYDDPRFPALKYEIVDFLNVTKFSATSDTIRRVSKMDRAAAEKNPNVKVAILTTKALMTGLSRMYEMSAGDTPWKVGIFGDEASAREWLGA